MSELSADRPQSLMTLCIQFVAEHIHLVDSLVGFPDIIGHKIFREAAARQKFCLDGDGTVHNMNVFCEAYGELMLSSADLSGCCLGINYCTQHLSCFLHLRELDVSCCGLGDDHELLSHVGHLPLLQNLSVCKNTLSDVGIQKLTSPYRVLGKGPGHLSNINVSENKDVTSVSVVKYFTRFPCLEMIDITSTSVKSTKDLLKTWKFSPVKETLTVNITMEGWTSEIVAQWMESVREKALSESCNKTAAKKFYSTSQKRNTSFNPSSQIQHVPGYKLTLKRIKRIENKSEDAFPPAKRLKLSDVCSLLHYDNDQETSPLTSSENTSSPAVDEDLMKQYMY